MTKRYTISSLEHMVRVLAQKPELLSLASLAPLQYVAAEAKKASATCGCNAGEVYRKYKGTFELALNNLGHGDHLTAKRVLNVDQLCYYVRENTGTLKLKCI